MRELEKHMERMEGELQESTQQLHQVRSLHTNHQGELQNRTDKLHMLEKV